MKKFLSVVLMLTLSVAMYAQKDVTKFLGIPVDGTKSAMIQKLKAKGFTYNSVTDMLEGEFNGSQVQISVVTNRNKVYRIFIADKYTCDESDIKIRFNNLCHQFENNAKYIGDENQTISDDEDISYEMLVNKKRYQAVYFQKLDDKMIDKYINAQLLTKYTAEQLADTSQVMQDKVSSDKLAYGWDYIKNNKSKTVWFMINSELGSYRILMYYDNDYNKSDGDEL